MKGDVVCLATLDMSQEEPLVDALRNFKVQFFCAIDVALVFLGECFDSVEQAQRHLRIPFATSFTPFTRYNRLSNRLYNLFDNRFDNRLYTRYYRLSNRLLKTAGCQTGLTTGLTIGLTTGCIV